MHLGKRHQQSHIKAPLKKAGRQKTKGMCIIPDHTLISALGNSFRYETIHWGDLFLLQNPVIVTKTRQLRSEHTTKEPLSAS